MQHRLSVLLSALCALFAFALVACQREGTTGAESPGASASPKPVTFQNVEWPKLPARYLPEGGQSVTIRSPMRGRVLGIEDLTLSSEELKKKRIRVVAKELRFIESRQGMGYMDWNLLSVQPEGGVALSLHGVEENNKLVGFRYDLQALRALKPADQFALLDPTGWRVVAVEAPVEGDLLDVRDFPATRKEQPTLFNVRALRLANHAEGRVGLVWVE